MRKPAPQKKSFHGNRHSSEIETEYANTSAKKLKDSSDEEFRIG